MNRSMWRTGLAAVICVLLVSPATRAAQGDGDLKEIAAYRLTMERVKKVQVATRAMVAEMQKDPKIQAAMKLQAEIEALQQKDELTDAEAERLEQLEAQQEALGEAANVLGDAQSLREMEAKITGFPPMAKALQQAGMPPREYATFMMAMVQASMAAGFKKAGLLKELPPGVSPENVKFVEEHEAELKAMQEEFERLGKGL